MRMTISHGDKVIYQGEYTPDKIALIVSDYPFRIEGAVMSLVIEVFYP